MKPMPATVAEIRVELCPLCAEKATDPCAACDHGHWGPYVICEPDLPPPITIVANLATAIAAETKAVFTTPAIPEKEARRRFAICQACEHFRPSDERCAHSGCGCFLRIKTAWRSQHCPIKKW